MPEWNTEFHKISVRADDKFARIKADKALKNYLMIPGNGSLKLADFILNYYDETMKKSLEIKRHSLAIEILAHTYADTFAKAISLLCKNSQNSVFQKALKAMKEIEGHTEIIDCGERSVDSNRHVWDSLEPFHTLIYTALGPLC